jgi:hypothetical protein
MASTGFNPFARHTENQPSSNQEKSASTPEPQPATAGNAAETGERSPARPVEKEPAPASRAGNPFSHHEVEHHPKPERTRKSPPAQELLLWLQDTWKKPIISLRDIQVYAPRAIRDRETATSHAETLARHGWLAEIKAHRRDRRVWRTPPAGATALPEN